MRKVFLDRTENKGPISVFIKDVEVIPAGTTIYSMSEKSRNDEYQRYADEYDMRFIFDDDIPEINFYAVPQIDIFAKDSKGGFWGTLGSVTDFEEKLPICYIDRERNCFCAAGSGQEFLKSLKENKIELKPEEGVVFYDSKAVAERELEFIKLEKLENDILRQSQKLHCKQRGF